MARDRSSLAVSLMLLACVAAGALPLLSQTAAKHATPSSTGSTTGSQPLRPLFLPPVVYDCAVGPFALGDVNGDGKLDVVSDTCVLLGNGDGTFTPLPPPVEGEDFDSVALADVNGDGKLDAVLRVPGGVVLVLGNGDGTFQPPTNLSLNGIDPTSLAVGDLNGDGKPDLAVAVFIEPGRPSLISVLLGNGDGTFQPPVSYSAGGSSVQGIVVADVNGDGIPDLEVTDSCGLIYNCYPTSSGTVSVLLGNGDGTFQPAAVYDSGGNGSNATEENPLTVADLRGKGISDIAVVNSGSSSIAVLQGNGDGSFQPAVAYPTGGGIPVSVAVTDANGDGIPDLSVVNNCSSTVNGSICGDSVLGVLLGKGDGTFQSVFTYDLGGQFTGSGQGWLAEGALADLDGDGKPDLIAAVRNINVLINDTGAPPPTITVKSSPNPSVFWQPVTLTARLTSSVTPPTGAVNFFVDSVQVGSAPIASGTASFNLPLAIGPHSIRAVYPGSDSLYGNTSSVKTQSVNVASTTVSVASSKNPSARSKPIFYTATVSSQYGGAATGSIVFTTGSQTLGTAPLSGNQAVLATTSFATDGAYPVVATYGGDVNNTGNISPAMTQYIDSLTSRTAVTTSASTAMVGQPVTFTAFVTPAHGTVPDGEIVSFYYHSSVLLGTAATVGGKASLTTSSIPAGNWTVKAIYPGDGSYLSSFGSVTETITRYATTTTLTSAPNPSVFKQQVTFTATVKSAGPQVPTGTVIFRDGTISIGSATLANGLATLKKAMLKSGVHSITASYQGDGQSAKSISSVVQQVVN